MIKIIKETIKINKHWFFSGGINPSTTSSAKKKRFVNQLNTYYAYKDCFDIVLE
jgi:hypothetical protein